MLERDVTLLDIFMIPSMYFFMKAVKLHVPRSNRKCPYDRWQITYCGTGKICYAVIHQHRDLAEPDGLTPIFLFTVERIRDVWTDAGGNSQHAVTTRHLAFDGIGYFLWDPEWGGVVVDLPPFFRVYQDWHDEVIKKLAEVY